MEGLKREVPGTPFVPAEGPELHRRCAEIFGIQCAGLAKRIEQLPAGTHLNLGVSGGLDSTLALLVAVTTCDMLGLDRRQMHGLTMPGFGTTDRTRTNALALMEHLGVSSDTIDISALALQAFREIGHSPFGIDCRGIDVASFRAALARVPPKDRCDLTFENVQARLRTFLLMSKGFVVGTGDLSELALGWSTYNGDHMSMYNPNCSIPKTLVRFLVRYWRSINSRPARCGRHCCRSSTRRFPGALAGRRRRPRDRAVDRGHAGPLRAARLHAFSRRSLRIFAGEDLVPEPVRHVYPGVSAGAVRADDADVFHAVFSSAI